MSHFTVMVIGNDPEKQLAPYQENNMGNCPKEYLKFNDVEAEHRESYSTDETTVFVSPEGKLFSKYNDQFRVAGGLLEGSKYMCPKGWTEKEVPVSVLYPTFEQYMSDYCGNERNEDGTYGYWENPNAKWDWYLLGGRWTGFFKLKKGAKGIVGDTGIMTPTAKPGYVDQARLRDIDTQGMRVEAKQDAINKYNRIASFFGGEIPTLEFKWKDLLADETKTIDEKRFIYHDQIAIKRLNEIRNSDKLAFRELAFLNLDDFQISLEEYADKAANEAMTPFSVLKDGKWSERGEMGWWGIVSNERDRGDWDEEFNKLIDSLPEDTLISIYDCHI
ncbi:hypothetical protein [Parapedobacter indicus]|uniref:Uncharacterized protein n=1 Tax=Parapedobacter indicus TaxID=1477437 RepID=A0A1I3UZY3_9SPHI|nr:hypothetical protein [Parapedobacter indicus]PPK99028.1 hypothetical protein CLV26_11558 [Parapedobacter indicus]SFJ88233.1 hypothetical protein SAMN05444682_115119 [Parapedobacter indicus]